MSPEIDTRRRCVWLFGGFLAMTVLIEVAATPSVPTWRRIVCGVAAAVTFTLLARYVHRWAASAADRRSHARAGLDHPPSFLPPPDDMPRWLVVGLTISVLPPVYMERAVSIDELDVSQTFIAIASLPMVAFGLAYVVVGVRRR